MSAGAWVASRFVSKPQLMAISEKPPVGSDYDSRLTSFDWNSKVFHGKSHGFCWFFDTHKNH